MALPGMSLEDAMHRCAAVLNQRRPVVLANMPNRPSEPGQFEASVEDLEALGIQPTTLGWTDRPKEERFTAVLKLAPVEGASAKQIADAVTLLTLIPRILQVFMSLVRPWHMALIDPKHFPLGEKPSEEDLTTFVASLARAMCEWGVLDLGNNEE